jgi:hypothetical protein
VSNRLDGYRTKRDHGGAPGVVARETVVTSFRVVEPERFATVFVAVLDYRNTGGDKHQPVAPPNEIVETVELAWKV